MSGLGAGGACCGSAVKGGLTGQRGVGELRAKGDIVP